MADAPDTDAVSVPRWQTLTLVVVLVLLVPAIVGGFSVLRSNGLDGPRGVDAATRPALTSTDSSCYPSAVGQPVGSTAPPSSGASAVRFTEVTAAAGLCHLQQELKSPPDCRFSRPGDRLGSNPDQNAALFAACTVERMSGGAAVDDYDGDGHPDVYLTQVGLGAPGRLYRNDGTARFTDVTTASGLDRVVGNGNGAAWVDIDRDGDRDLVVTVIGGGRDLLFVNGGDGTFREDGVARGVAMDDGQPHRGFGIAVGDYDGDGFADLFVTDWEAVVDWKPQPRTHARLLHNRGSAAPGFFDDATQAAGVVLGDPVSVKPVPALEGFLTDPGAYRTASFAPAFVDLDGDGRQDLVITSDFGTSQLFWNEGGGRFVDGTHAAGVGKEGNGMGSAFADIDGDGRLDWFVTAIHGHRPDQPDYYTGNKLYLNRGDRTFEDATGRYGVADGYWGWGAAAGDVDHDGHPDLLMTNGQWSGVFHDALGGPELAATPKQLWMNTGSAPWAEVAQAAGLTTRADGKGLVAFDADGDGDLDVLQVNTGQHPTFYRNDTPTAADWIAVRVTDAPGATVTVIDERGVRHVGSIGNASAFLGQSDPIVNVGLGSAPGPVTIEVDDPHAGRRTLGPVAPRQLVDVPRRP